MAREIHDGLGQMLTALKFGIENLGDAAVPATKVQQNLAHLRDLVTQTIAEARSLSFDLMPAVLQDFGLASALKQLANQTTASTGLAVRFVNEWNGSRLPKNLEIGLYRISQEALHNALKYAQATEVTIALWAKKKCLHLQISDNGQGFPVQEAVAGAETAGPAHGISNMKERAFLLDGQLTLTSLPGHGTQVHVKIPHSTYSYEQDQRFTCR